MKTLILTGWFWEDYACAAAIALRHYKEADIMGMSTRRLPEYLSQLSGYNEVVILGVGLIGNPALLEDALGKLQRKKVRVRWISSLEVPENINENITSKLEIFLQIGVTLSEAVSSCFNVSGKDLEPLLHINSSVPSAIKHYRQLLEAASYFYRNYQDEAAYGNAIRHLAAGDPESRWSEDEKNMVAQYKRFGHREIQGKSETVKALHARIDLIAPKDRARVLILGESGTGKETIALLVHSKSPRRDEPFIAFNCASVNPGLLEDRFFGHEKGAFTGAGELKRGLFEMANGGTLFLDEIGELPLEAQGLLLRVLEGGRFTRIGDREEISVDVRLITATNRDLPAMVREGKFREDLFHRLNVVQIHAPALREHKEDIGDIANSLWLREFRRRLTQEQIAALMEYDFPGNVRELGNLLERAIVLEENDFRKLLHEHKEMIRGLFIAEQAQEEYPDELELAIKHHVNKVYEKNGRNLSRTADVLKAARNTVRKYLGK